MPSATASAPGRQPPQKARAEKGGRPAACDRLHHPHLEEQRVRSGTQALLTRPWMERAEACGMDAGWEERWLGEPGAGVLRGLALKGWEETRAPRSPPTRHSFLQHHNSKTPILWCSAFFTVGLSHLFMSTGKSIALTRQTFVSCVRLSATLWTVACQAPLFMEFSRQQYWSG